MPGGKAIAPSRLFGSAVAGAGAAARHTVKGRRLGTVAAAIAAGRKRAVATQVQAAASAVRGRGRVFSSAVKCEAAVLSPVENVGRDDDAARQHPLEPLAGVLRALRQRWEPGEPRWQHDQFDGPQTVGSAVFVRGLPSGATAHQLGGLFSSAGQVASVQVDSGPLPTATVGFVRRDAAAEAERRFHGQWLQGSQLKVSAKGESSRGLGGEDEDFWRRELQDMQRHSGAAGRPAAGGSQSGLPEDQSDAAAAVARSGSRQVRGRGPCVFVSSAAEQHGKVVVAPALLGPLRRAKELRRSVPYGERPVCNGLFHEETRRCPLDPFVEYGEHPRTAIVAARRAASAGRLAVVVGRRAGPRLQASAMRSKAV